MQGNNRAKLHIFFHLTTLKRNYYVFWRIKTLFLQFFFATAPPHFTKRANPLRKKNANPLRKKNENPLRRLQAGSRIIDSHL